MTPDPVCHAEHCITCGDDGVPMTVVRVDELRGLALCEDETGARQSVETALVDPVAPGDRLLVHAGTAIFALGPGGAPGRDWEPLPDCDDVVDTLPLEGERGLRR